MKLWVAFGHDAVGGGDGDRVGAAGAGGRGAGQHTGGRVRVTPLGRVPVSVNVGAGKPVAVTVKVPAVPTVKVVALPEVMDGAWSTVSVKLWVALGQVPLVAVMVIG